MCFLAVFLEEMSKFGNSGKETHCLKFRSRECENLACLKMPAQGTKN